MANAKGSAWRTMVAATIGNTLEWYDFLIYGYLAVIISNQFFPDKDPSTSLLLTTATFGVGFVVRPIGAILLGIYADKKGRKPALTLVIFLMFLATAMLALSPTYKQIGIFAPLIVVASRIIQGIAVAGDFGAATTLLVEHAPPGRRGFYGSWSMVAQTLGVLMAVLAGNILTTAFTPETLASWAWRLPFLFGLVIGPIGIYIRRNIHDAETFVKAKADLPTLSLIGMLGRYPAALFVSLALSAVTNVMVYVLIAFLPIYAVQMLKLPVGAPFTVLTAMLLARLALVPLFGHLSDKIGRKLIIGAGLILFTIFIYPAFVWLRAYPTMQSLMVIELFFACLMAAILGPLSAALAELFPTGIRSTGLSLTYNITASLLGGLTPLILTWAVSHTGNKLMPAHYLVGFLVLGIVSLFFYKEQDSRSSLLTQPAKQGSVRHENPESQNTPLRNRI